MKKSLHLLCLATLLVAFTSTSAVARQGAASKGDDKFGIGIKTGLGIDPDQFVIGAGFVMARKLGIANVAPSVDFGFGSGLTAITFNADLLLQLRVEETSVGFYGGAGPTLAFYDFNGGTDWRFGATLVAGSKIALSKRTDGNLELRVGVGKVPDLRLLLAIFL